MGRRDKDARVPLGRLHILPMRIGCTVLAVPPRVRALARPRTYPWPQHGHQTAPSGLRELTGGPKTAQE
eukprot:5769665-Pyramimonas_sp.AAC.1